MKEKKDRESNPLFILFIFIFIIIAIFALPYFYEKINKKELVIPGEKITNEKEESSKIESEQSTSEYILINGSGTLNFNGISLSNINIDKTILTFDLKKDEAIDLNNAGYYIEFYKNKVTFIARRILNNMTASSGIDISNIKVDKDTYIQISHIADEAIPKKYFETDESGLSSISCTKGNYIYNYDFKLNKLIKINRKYTYSSKDLDQYANVLFEYQKKAKNYSDLDGITVSIAEGNNSFIYTMEIDYENNPNNIKEDYLFSKDELNNIILFKMEAAGFDCE